jgi:hypothetical protein
VAVVEVDVEAHSQSLVVVDRLEARPHGHTDEFDSARSS